jgi:hypothetical protein
MNCWKPRNVIAGRSVGLFLLAGCLLLASGCGRDVKHEHTAKAPGVSREDTHDHGEASGAKIDAARAKLSAEDRQLVEAQEFCVVQTKQRLGSMGVPVKLDIEGQPVFLCCKACTRKATSDPAKTLKILDELKAKVKAEPSGD